MCVCVYRSMHAFVHVYLETLLCPQTAKAEPLPVDPEMEPSQQLVNAIHLTQNPLGTPKHIATFVVNTLFNAIVEVSIGNMAKVPEKMMVWFKVYR